MNLFTGKIIDFEPRIFGVDLSDISVKVIQLEKQGGIVELRSFADMAIPLGCIDNGKIVDKAKVAAILKEVVKKAGPKKINTRKVICSIPESKAFLRIINIPNMEEEEIKEAIKWEMEANIPLPLDKVYFDWQVIGNDKKNKNNILTVAVAKEIVDDQMEVLKMAGLDVYGLEVESIASARSLIKENEKVKGDTTLIVDLGSNRTSFIMVVDGFTFFTSSISFSSESINDAISKRLNVNLKEAEEIKINYGIEYLNSDNPIFNATKYLLENLIMEIEKNLDFYFSINKSETKMEKIILCGGGANLKGIIPFLVKRLNIQVEIGNPWINMNFGKKLPSITKQDSVRYSTVIGLALRGLQFYDN
jgi:type IV pilus assembly protein PilM